MTEYSPAILSLRLMARTLRRCARTERGKYGSTVKLKILHPGEDTPVEVTVTRKANWGTTEAP
jgi:hypothetical protein